MPATDAGRRLPQSPTCMIAVPLDKPPKAEFLTKLRELGADLFELRLDLSELRTAKEAADAAAIFAGHPLIVTCRSKREGGRPRTEEEREAMLRACLPHAQAVDIELSSPELLAAIKPLCDDSGPDLIISGHYLDDAPDLKMLLERADEAAAAGADIIKIVTAAGSMEHVDTLAQVLQVQLDQGRRMVAMGMGEAVALSRQRLGKMGSCFVFAGISGFRGPGPALPWLVKHLR